MDNSRFRVAYFERPMHQSFIDTLERADDAELVRIELAEDPVQIRAKLATCHGYYARAARDELPRQWHVGSSLLEYMPSLLLVASYGAGYDTIDIAACTAAGVAVTNQAGGNAEGVAEHTLGMMISLAKRIPESQTALREGESFRRETFMGRELAGRTVGLVGLGHVGTRVAGILKLAFGCKVLAYDPYLDAQTCSARGAEKVEFDDLLEGCDVLSLHCPLTHETRGLIDSKAFARMRMGSLFVSTARGSIHDEAALLQALDSGRIAGAGLDVWEREPPSRNHPLLVHPRVMASPHIAGVTHESRERVARMAAESFISVASGRLPERVLNPEVWSRVSARRAKTFGA